MLTMNNEGLLPKSSKNQVKSDRANGTIPKTLDRELQEILKIMKTVFRIGGKLKGQEIKLPICGHIEPIIQSQIRICYHERRGNLRVIEISLKRHDPKSSRPANPLD